ncbi:hypothetical protein MUK70_25650 [Dyadobacter chenwenxiniae]|uniref:Addiction module component n=1 Tax=Dyadobacter chenwenxiniae TaxID=2906456 RepID=A0A9X1PQ18_9BACT|nr:hypothetical protein [Dyadobacter chenwenxiniae]MCF0064385.1 hypothetical protein [Dyadobacter chenwenxiniae]UON82409.1 hypothetical protein MUK70_25650 [Dyadobacter chenwenxiniae]
MKLQYISDSQGVTIGVYIPITEWNALNADIEHEETDNVLQWHKDIVSDRLVSFKKNPEEAIDFDTAMDEIEKSL